MDVFFYGLFMDPGLLASKGINPGNARIARLGDYALRIGNRATLVRRQGDRVFGVVMEVDARDLQRLYADDSVADYLPETVTVELEDGSPVEAACYNLPARAIQGTDKDYTRALSELADRLGLEESYVDEIRRLAEEGN